MDDLRGIAHVSARAADDVAQPRGVLLVSEAFTPLIDGVVRVVADLAESLSSAGIYVHIAASQMPGYVDPTPDITRLPSWPLPANAPYRLPLPCNAGRYLPADLAARIDVVHLHSSFESARSVSRWARALNKPTVTTVHTKYYEKIANTLGDGFLARALYRRFLSQVSSTDLVTCPGSMVATDLVHQGLDPHRLRIVPNGVPRWPDAEKPPPLALRRDDPLARRIDEAHAAGKAVLLFIGQHIREKNPHFLLDSFAALKHSGQPFLGLFVGAGDQAPALQRQASELGLSDDVVFVGAVHDRSRLSMIYALADLMTFPSTFECCPLVVMEAAQHELPTLGITGASGVSELLRDGTSGFLAPLEVRTYTQRIADALADRAHLQAVGRHAKRNVVRLQSDMTDDFLAIYRELLLQPKALRDTSRHDAARLKRTTLTSS